MLLRLLRHYSRPPSLEPLSFRGTMPTERLQSRAVPARPAPLFRRITSPLYRRYLCRRRSPMAIRRSPPLWLRKISRFGISGLRCRTEGERRPCCSPSWSGTMPLERCRYWCVALGNAAVTQVHNTSTAVVCQCLSFCCCCERFDWIDWLVE